MPNVYWLYKCKREQTPYSSGTGDWEADVFRRPWAPVAWGTIGVHRGVEHLRRGHLLVCQQSDDPGKTLVGLARVIGHTRGRRGTRVVIQAIERIGANIKRLKDADQRIARVPALQGGPIQTVYSLDLDDALHLIRSAYAQVLNVGSDAPRWHAVYERAARSIDPVIEDLPARERIRVVRQVAMLVRDARLRDAVLEHWPPKCAACGVEIRLGKLSECHIAHVRDVKEDGRDQIRNAMPLCRTHHWAFDVDIWAIRPRDEVIIVRRSLRSNPVLRMIHGQRLRRPDDLPDILIGADAIVWRWRRFVKAASNDL